MNTGALTSQLTAVDGKDIEPVSGNYFQLGIAQRIDLLMKIPDKGDAFPILAQRATSSITRRWACSRFSNTTAPIPSFGNPRKR
ncbi:MAG: hypothetical protein WAK31_17690 [Chthoniobacterales bacterium]